MGSFARTSILFIFIGTLTASAASLDLDRASETTPDAFVEMVCTASWGNYAYQNHVGYGSTCSLACTQAMNYCYQSAGRYNAQYCRVGSCYSRSR